MSPYIGIKMTSSGSPSSNIIIIFTGRNEVLAKVIFLQLSVIHSVHMGGGCLVQIFGGGCLLQFFGGGVCSKFSGGGCLLQFLEYGQRSAGTHPTGMHSCFKDI